MVAFNFENWYNIVNRPPFWEWEQLTGFRPWPKFDHRLVLTLGYLMFWAESKLFLSQNLDKKIHLENIAIPDLLRRVRKKRQKKTKPSVLLSSKLLGCQRIGYDDSEIAWARRPHGRKCCWDVTRMERPKGAACSLVEREEFYVCFSEHNICFNSYRARSCEPERERGM